MKATESQENQTLLEHAARAAGLSVIRWEHGVPVIPHPDEPDGKLWNPLACDGDEARLEALLQLHVEWWPAMNQVRVGTAEVHAVEPYGQDRQAARRRAGVRAATLIKGEKLS